MTNPLTSIVQGIGRAVAFTAGVVILPLAVAHATLTISETGSTLILPLFKSWVAAYSKVNPELQMTVGATGSAAGIAEAIAKHAQIGPQTRICRITTRWPIHRSSTFPSRSRRKR
jgi:ABC-type phosphate transport system substrate-binding protein